MQLVNEFVVPRGIDETWAVLTDVERIAPAMPGAQLTGVVDGKYNGTVKVKVGPVTAAYAGVASFRELDQANHHMVLDATGKESSGRGRAAAVVSADLVPEGEQTRVKVTTDLTISGPLAQFGRGAIAEVSTRLLNQFVTNLKAMVLADTPAPAAPPAPPAAAVDVASAAPIAAPATDLPASAPASGGDATPVTPDPATPPVPTQAATTEPAATQPAPPTVARPAPAPAEVNLLRVAAWPILKRLIPVIVVVIVLVVLIVWLV